MINFILSILGAHTCTFTMDLPEYSTIEIMYERLNYAISCCSSIDGDGIMDDVLNTQYADYDDGSEQIH